MVYFLLSFFVGGLLTLIPASRDPLNLVLAAFYTKPLNFLQMFVVCGLAFSVIFLTSREFILKNGYIAFWKVLLVITLLIVGLVASITNFPQGQF